MAADADTATAPEGAPPRAGAYWFDIVFGRTLPAIFFSVFVLDKAMVFADGLHDLAHPAGWTSYLNPLNQLLSLAYFFLLALLYVVRLPKRAGDARPAVILVSLVGSFSVIFITLLPGVPPRAYLLLPALLLAAGGLAYTMWSLLYLRRSFSILPEARRLVTGGPYGLSRHPLYLGEGVAAVGITVPTIGWAGALLLALFLAAQYIRIRTEERVLEGEFPEYGDYRRRVPRYLPDPRRLLVRP